MPVVKLYIDKFNGEVLIDENHPLAIAQRAKDSAPKAETPKGSESESKPAAKTSGKAK
jgi:hypothetical protein